MSSLKKRIFFLTLILLLSLIMVACDGITLPEPETEVVWEEYSNDYFSMRYPAEWEYRENLYGNKISLNFEEDDFDFSIIIEAIDQDRSAEEIYDEIKDELQDDILNLENELGVKKHIFEVISFEEVKIWDTSAIEIIYKDNFHALDIYVDLLNFSDIYADIEDYMSKYEDWNEYINNVSVEDLEEVKKLLLENDFLHDDQIIEDIDILLGLERTILWRKTKGVNTVYSDNVVIIKYEDLEENFDDNINIINYMIDSIEFSNDDS
ncbi:hypothetical protein [Natronospora cellulosivora (SeqCode)]